MAPAMTCPVCNGSRFSPRFAMDLESPDLPGDGAHIIAGVCVSCGAFKIVVTHFSRQLGGNRAIPIHNRTTEEYRYQCESCGTPIFRATGDDPTPGRVTWIEGRCEKCNLAYASASLCVDDLGKLTEIARKIRNITTLPS